MSGARPNNKKHIEDLENELRNCSLEIGNYHIHPMHSTEKIIFYLIDAHRCPISLFFRWICTLVHALVICFIAMLFLKLKTHHIEKVVAF